MPHDVAWSREITSFCRPSLRVMASSSSFAVLVMEPASRLGPTNGVPERDHEVAAHLPTPIPRSCQWAGAAGGRRCGCRWGAAGGDAAWPRAPGASGPDRLRPDIQPLQGRTHVDLFEHQAKELFAEYGVAVPRGVLARTPEEAGEVAEGFAAAGAPRVVVKAQVKTGGRGKAGGVKVADGPAEAQARAGGILGMDIKGHTVRTVLVEEASDIAQ